MPHHSMNTRKNKWQNQQIHKKFKNASQRSYSRRTKGRRQTSNSCDLYKQVGNKDVQDKLCAAQRALKRKMNDKYWNTLCKNVVGPTKSSNAFYDEF
mmetsp:Transcript_5882/g.5138  ORF Transcript_5882/g.5138 Transcript_5882/m.5138 type:complete len:97 (+) Transcript_5882:22-312(+)